MGFSVGGPRVAKQKAGRKHAARDGAGAGIDVSNGTHTEVTMHTLLLLLGCAKLQLDPPISEAHVVYDPAAGEIPLPNDALRDELAHHLSLPTDDPSLSAAEVELREGLNALDGWPSTTGLTLRFSQPVDPASLDDGAVQVWEWGASPRPVEGLELALSDDGLSLSIAAPGAWARGGRYLAFVVGGEHGAHTLDGTPLGPDAAFWYLRQPEPIDGYEHQRAFPGETRDERLATGAALEALRLQLEPYLDSLEENHAISREVLAAAWTFSVTARPELAMDRATERMPLPFDLLIDPDTGRVELPIPDSGDELEIDARTQLNRLSGFSVSAPLFFEFTAAVDPVTVTSNTIHLYRIDQSPESVPISARVMSADGDCDTDSTDAGCVHVVVSVDAEHIPLAPGATYALIVDEGLKGTDGELAAAMPMGMMLRGDAPLFADGQSTIHGVSDEDAARLEGVRVKLDSLLDIYGRDRVLAAWPFTTLDAAPGIASAVNLNETLGISAPPEITWSRPPYSFFYDDALDVLFPGLLNPGTAVYLGRTLGVDQVVEGTLRLPFFLDPETRRWREDGGNAYEDVGFWAMVPDNPPSPMPVVIFGHAIVTDRRFLLMIAGALASRGYASVAIDFPYHGDRAVCADTSLIAVPNFFPEELQPYVGYEDPLIYAYPCASGADATCSDDGLCLDEQGRIEDFTTFPVLSMEPASGAAFLDMSDLAHIPDHFMQAFADLGGLHYSLQHEDWTGVFGGRIDTDHFYYAGQSLGSIIGVPYVSATPDIERAVFNVPGADMVNLFRESTYFQPQIQAWFDSRGLVEGSFEQVRLLAIASWLIDTVDPDSVAHLYAGRSALIQIDRIDENTGDLIIPNRTTLTLQRASGMDMIEYPSTLHADLIVPLLGDAMLNDMVDYLDGELP